jgi:hypothetical protein
MKIKGDCNDNGARMINSYSGNRIGKLLEQLNFYELVNFLVFRCSTVPHK